MDKRYQVFVSSTFADLKNERQRVIQTLMEMDCIPAGMELFPAADEEQWAFIKSVIDDCDYYLLIIGGRYGSTTKEGISYTEKEYDYAIERGIRVIALVHENPEAIPLGKSEKNPELRLKLQQFRGTVSANRLVKSWNRAEELPGIVALSLSKTIKSDPAVGWVRANMVASEELLSEVNELRKQNDSLSSKLNELTQEPIGEIEGLAGLDEEFTITGTHSSMRDAGRWAWKSTLSWEEIFGYIAPYLMKHPNKKYVKSILLDALIKRENIGGDYQTIDDQNFQTVTLQFRALGLIVTQYTKTIQGNMAFFWSYTAKGEHLMLELRTVRSNR